MVLLKFMPELGHPAQKAIQFVPESCPTCIQRHDPDFEQFNSRETVLQFEVPRGRSLELGFDAPASQTRRVIINDTDLPLRRDGKRLWISIPPLTTPATWAPALETDIVETGMVLRVELADPARRAGAYADGRFPVLERQAADNLSFAMREVIRRMGLGQQVAQEKTGLIMVMGFDTNNPAGHRDAPPHVHMHLRWPNNVGTQISHYYLNDQGLLTENKVGVRGLQMPQRRFGPGEKFTTIDNKGQPVYAHTITQEGYLLIERSRDAATCLLKPLEHGFQSGVQMECGPLGNARVTVQNDYLAGRLVVRTGDILEVFRYDPDTGKLTSPTEEPPIPVSVRNPEW